MAEKKGKPFWEMTRAEQAAEPVITIEGPEQPTARKARLAREQEHRRREEQARKSLEALAREFQQPPIPEDVSQQTRLSRLAGVESLLQQRARCAAQRAELEAKHAKKLAEHQQNRGLRAERAAEAIVQGNTPIPDDGAGRREVDEIRVVEEEVTHLDRAEQYLDRQARETLAIALKTQLWPAQRQLRREGLRQMLDACRLLASAQERILAAERAGQEECGRVRGAVKLDLGPESCVTPGAAILRSDPHDRTGRATVTLGREPDQIEQLDTPSSAIIRRFLDGYLGVPAVHSATWFHRLSPTTVGEAIRLLEAELATMDAKEQA